MRSVTFSILVAAGAAFGSAANAQTPAADPPASSTDVSTPPPMQQAPQWAGDPQLPCCDLSDTRRGRSLGHGVAALEANDFVQAEEIFADVLRRNRNDAGVRFYLGVAKMNLGKWDEAKRYLKSAARELRRLPDPKSHLGVTYAKLGDIAGAYAQRDRLVQMAEACKGSCEASPYILDGIQMIDNALAETPTSSS